ncbi:hypothetical protein HN51_066049, partial [Arachis hypogaea]
MDVGRAVLVQTELRTRLDAGTWGTIGVGLVEGDFGFGFSAIEVETLVQYQVLVVVIIFKNEGVYG